MLSTCFVFILLATLTCCSQEPETNNQRTIIDFNRNIKADVDGKIEIGPCGRPKSILNADITDSGNTKIQGNVFNLMETAGKLAELLKLIGSRFKPLVPCSSTPAPTNDESTQSLCISELKKCAAILDQTIKNDKTNIVEDISKNEKKENEKCISVENVSVEVVTNSPIKPKLNSSKRNLRYKNQRRRHRKRRMQRNTNSLKRKVRSRLSRRRPFRKQRRFMDSSLSRDELSENSFFDISMSDNDFTYPFRKNHRRRSRSKSLRRTPFRKCFRKSLRAYRTVSRERPRLCRCEQQSSSRT